MGVTRPKPLDGWRRPVSRTCHRVPGFSGLCHCVPRRETWKMNICGGWALCVGWEFMAGLGGHWPRQSNLTQSLQKQMVVMAIYTGPYWDKWPRRETGRYAAVAGGHWRPQPLQLYLSLFLQLRIMPDVCLPINGINCNHGAKCDLVWVSGVLCLLYRPVHPVMPRQAGITGWLMFVQMSPL